MKKSANAKSNMPMKPITVLLAEDHQIVREGFRSLLKHEADIEVVGEAQTGRQAVQLAKKLRPAVIVMDIAMPLLNGLEATRQIRKDLPEVRVLILSAYSDDAYVDQMSALGAAGFLLKQTSSHVLAKAIREVDKGNTYFSPSVSRHLNHQKTLNREGLAAKKNNRLSSREVEVLQLIAEGKPNKQMAAELGVSFKTVDKHRQHLMAKLDIHDVAGLTRYAIAQGIIESSVQLSIVRG
jgi:DNA-binding NarL/FixJ family response regulator